MPKLVSQKNIPKESRSVLNISSFKGVDLSNAPSNVAKNRSPEAPNMAPRYDGFAVKRTGYKHIKTYEGRVNGKFYLDGVEHKELIHAGTKLYDDQTGALLYEGMKDERSKAWQLGGKLWLVDGKRFLVYGKFPSPDDAQAQTYQVKPVEEIAYVPVIVIGRSPTGGGTPFEAINLIGKKWREDFLGTANTTKYQLSFGELDDTPVRAQKMDAQGNWVDLAEPADFTVNRLTGEVTFKTAPGPSPATGRDNVRITASKTREGYAERINGCDISILYGVSGNSDRLFVSGNPQYPNYDWFSGMNDPTFFGDMNYSVLGQDSSAIVGYSIVGDRLAAHKDRAENGRNVILRAGTLVDGQAAFQITSALQGEGAVAKHSFAYLQTEPLFLTALGVYAITTQDVTGDRYAQNRSFYINKALAEEPGLSQAYGMVYKDFYMLCLNGKVYILNGAQKSYEKGEPYSTFQYECYYWLNVPARVMWQRDETLYFGTDDGKVMEFYRDYDDYRSYYDLAQPIVAYWDLPDFDGDKFYKNKTVRYVAVRLASATATSVKILAQVRGMWVTLKEEMTKARYFAYSRLRYSKFSYNCDITPRTVGQKVKLKKIDKARFRLLNDQPGEPFGIYEISVEFTEGGYYKR